MFNAYIYNLKPFGEQFSGNGISEKDEIVFNGYSLYNDTIKVNKISFDNSHDIQSDSFRMPLSDGGGELNYFIREKTVTMQGRIKASNREQLNIEIDRFKKSIVQGNKDLDIKVNGVVRTAKASLMNGGELFNREHYNVTFLPFTVVFRVLNKFKETQRNIKTFTGKTGNFVEEQYNDGSAKANPVAIFSFASASGTDEVSLNIGGDEIVISESIVASDILTIDVENKQILLNDTEIDYTGIFPQLNVGNNSYNVNVNGTCEFSFTLYYFNTYL